MIEGIGMDLIEIKRLERVLSRQQRFVDRILTDKEKERFSELSASRRLEFLAGRFAAKEAYAKACGTGIGKELSWQDIEILSDPSGKPKMVVKDSESKLIHVSITHTKQYAAAQVVIESVEI